MVELSIRALFRSIVHWDGFYGTLDNIFGIKMCLRIQESRFRINLGVVDHRRRVFSTPESKKVPIFAHSRESKNPRKSDIFDFFELFRRKCSEISVLPTQNH